TAELEEELNCSICLNIYKNPILLSCGHNFCKDCIENVWESQAAKGTYSCPECFVEFREIPPLQRNLKLCSVIEQLLSTSVMQKQATVYCTFCLETHLMAVKTCLQCETSLCKMHLERHNETVDHTLIEPTNSLDGRKCQEHKELIKYYCTDDGTHVCVTCCVAGKHKNHNVKPMTEVAERSIEFSYQKLCPQSKNIEQVMNKLQKHLRSTVKAASEEKNRATTLYSEIKELLEAAERGTLDSIDTEAKRIADKISLRIENLEKKKMDNLYKLQEMKNMNEIKDPLAFINESKYRAVSTRDVDNEEQEEDCKNNKESEAITKENLAKQMFSLVTETQLNGFIKRLLAMKETKGFTLQNESNLTFDADTASPFLILSNDLKMATATEEKQSYPQNPKRFFHPQVLCSQSFSSGCHFWKFEISKQPFWGLGITYNNIEREGENSLLGGESFSWALIWFNEKLYAGNNNENKCIKWEMAPQKVGVYLDYTAGILSFFEVSELFRHLYTFHCSFTEPVYPGCLISQDGWVQILS
uniref:Uncharacterized protein n=2 Tax=Latimeria chalumnae TaxID=7897 RepID=H3A8A7_LATCH